MPDPVPHTKKFINLLFVLPSFDTGGSEKLVVDIIKHLGSSHFNPVLAVFHGGKYEVAFQELGYPFYVIHQGGVKSRLEVVRSLRAIVHRHNIDVVNTHHPSSLIQGFVPFRLLCRVKWVHTEHTRLNLEAGIHKRALLATRLLLRAVNLCVGISQSVCQYLEAEMGVPNARIRKVVNGVDLARFELAGFDRAGYRARLVQSDDILLIGMFANFRPQKNHANLVRAVALLKQRTTIKFEVLLCGDGETLAEVEELIKELNLASYIRVLGVRFDIPELMHSVDIYCLPSRYEGLPLSLLEAMACRRAIAATDVVGNDEVVVDGHNGLLCADDDPEDLAQKLELLLADGSLRASLGANAYNTASQMSSECMMQTYDSLFTEVCR